MVRWIAYCMLLVMLAGCASAPPVLQRGSETDGAFSFSARVSLKQREQRDSAGLRWVHRAGGDDIQLLAPLGQTVARIQRKDGVAILEADGKRYTAEDMEGLMQQVLGWQLPLSGMRYWVQAQAVPDAVAQMERNQDGQLGLLLQQGWEIRYLKYAAATDTALPLRISMQRGTMKVMLVIDEWEAQ